VVTDSVAFGYVSVPVSASNHETGVIEAGCVLAAFAASQGYALSGVFSDVRDRTDSGLYAMLTAIRRGEAVAVLVLDMRHLRHVGCLAGADLRTASRYVRARVMTVADEDSG
jgi:hypothetical protein